MNGYFFIGCCNHIRHFYVCNRSDNVQETNDQGFPTIFFFFSFFLLLISILYDKIKIGRAGETEVVEVLVWNETVANLTLMVFLCAKNEDKKIRGGLTHKTYLLLSIPPPLNNHSFIQIPTKTSLYCFYYFLN